MTVSTAPRALIVHAHDWLGVARLPRLLHRAGYIVDALAGAGSPLARSRYVNNVIAAPRDPAETILLLRDVLLDPRNEYSWVTLADDSLVDAAGRYAGEAWLDRCFPVDHRSPRAALVRQKFAFIDACATAGIPIPASAIVSNAHDALVAGRFGFPLMIKQNTGSGGTGVRKVENESDLIAAFTASSGAPVNIEEFVDGFIGATEILFDRGVPVCWWSFVKEKRFPHEFGPSAVRRSFEPPGIGDVLSACGDVTGFHGFAALCWIYRERDRRLVVLELNPRPGSGMHLPPAEARFIAGLRAMRSGTRAPVRPVPQGIVYRMFPQDLERALSQGDLLAACDWLPKRGRRTDIPFDDAALLRAQVLHVARAFLPRTLALASRVFHLSRRWSAFSRFAR